MSQRHCLRPKHFAKVQGPTAAEGAVPAKSDKLSAHMKYRTTAHLVYNLNFHIVFVTKYRNKVLTGKVEAHLKTQVYHSQMQRI